MGKSFIKDLKSAPPGGGKPMGPTAKKAGGSTPAKPSLGKGSKKGC